MSYGRGPRPQTRIYLPDMPHAPGVYFIYNTANDRIYVGETNNLRKRCCGHITDLFRNAHTNNDLQNDWNNYGADVFRFGVLVEHKHPLTSRRDIESCFIRAYQSTHPTFGYNIAT